MTGVGLSINAIGSIINNLFVTILFGNLILVGLLILIIVFLWIVINGGKTTNQSVILVGMSALILYLTGSEIWSPANQTYLPVYIGAMIIAVVVGINIFGWYRVFDKN